MSKKVLTVILSMLMVITLLPISISAEEDTKSYEFEINEDVVEEIIEEQPLQEVLDDVVIKEDIEKTGTGEAPIIISNVVESNKETNKGYIEIYHNVEERITESHTELQPGEEITLKVFAKEGYILDLLEVKGNDIPLTLEKDGSTIKYTFEFPSEGNWPVRITAKFVPYVCTIGDKKYTSLEDAINEAESGDTIELVSPIVSIRKVKKDEETVIKPILVNEEITIVGTDENKGYKINTNIGFEVTGKLTLENVTVNSTSICADVHGENAELIIDETATLNATSAIDANVQDAYCIKVYDGAKLTVGGKLTNKYGKNAVVVIDNSDSENTTEVIINNTANISGKTGIYQKGGILTIDGGSITATGNKEDFIIEEIAEDETRETINPNTGDAIVLDYSGCEGETPNVAINSGYFYSTNNNPISVYATKGTENDPVEKFVKGGYFSKLLSDDILYSDKYADYSCVDNVDGSTSTNYPYIVEKDNDVAQIGKHKYTKLEKALADVKNKETINLLTNITSTATFTISEIIEFNIDSKGFSNGVTIDAAEGLVLSTKTNGNVTTYRTHSHGDKGWNYSVKDNVLTATCKDCNGETPYSISATITNDGGTYNGEQFEATIENKTNFETTTGASIKAMYRKDKSTRTSEVAPINAGTYTCYIVVDGLKTREYASKRFTIAKATPTVTALPTASTITYGQSLRDSKLTGGTGSVAGKFTWKNGNTKPNATNGSEYKVVFTPTDSNNYSSVEVNVSIKVNKADYRTAVTLNDWTYGQKSNNPRVSYNPENGNVTYTYAKEGSDEFTAIKPTNAGKYVVKANIAETANYNSAEATDRFEIRKANGSGSVSVKDFTYTGKPETKPDVKLSSTTLDASKATYKFYTKNQRGQYVEVKPTIWNAGTYYVRAEFKSNNNYNAYTTDYVRFVVKKADVNYKKPEKNVLTYNGQDQTLIKAGGSFDGTMYYTLKYDVRHPERTIWTDNVKNITGKNAGEYTVYYYVKGDNNHNDSNVETIKVEIAKKKLEVVWSKTVEFTYNSQLQAPTATLKGVIGEEEVILGYRYRQGMNTNAQPIDAGKYIATTYLNENVKTNSNYELIENTTKCFFKINKKVLTATWETLSFKYDGTNKKPTLILNGVEDKDMDSVNATIKVKGNAVEEGFYKVKASLDNKNYSLEEMRTIFFIFDDEPMHDGTITTGSVNSDKQRFLSTYTYKITEDNLDDILAYETGDKDAADKDAIVDALDNNGSIHFFTKVETTKEEDKNAFAEYSLNDNNAIFFDVNLYASIDGDTKVRRLFNTNGYNVKVELTLTGDEASKIVGSRKNYYLLREHDGKVEKVDVDVKKNLDDGGNLISCTITFESNKFSTFALYSKNKPTPTPYIAPKTGIN